VVGIPPRWCIPPYYTLVYASLLYMPPIPPYIHPGYTIPAPGTAPHGHGLVWGYPSARPWAQSCD